MYTYEVDAEELCEFAQHICERAWAFPEEVLRLKAEDLITEVLRKEWPAHEDVRALMESLHAVRVATPEEVSVVVPAHMRRVIAML